VRLFDDAAAEYDAARPSYLAGLYDLLEFLVGGLAGKVVADGGARMPLHSHGDAGWAHLAKCPPAGDDDCWGDRIDRCHVVLPCSGAPRQHLLQVCRPTL